LKLPDFSQVEPALRQFVAKQAGDRKNTFSDLPGSLRQRIGREWRRLFEEWSYDR